MNERDRFAGCLLGLAVGDALGAQVEFMRRGTFPPVTDMVGGGPHQLPAGAWTDDTSMALCLAESLLECRGFDARDQMTRYLRWLNEGHLSSIGRCFDIGHTTARALRAFEAGGEPFSGPTGVRTAGNGSLMRLAPVAMAYHPHQAAVIEMCGESSRTTHGAAACVDACRLFGGILFAALSGADQESVMVWSGGEPDLALREPRLRAIAKATYRTSELGEIRGSGYVVDCLEAAMWAFGGSASFEEAVLAAVNLGDDADTTGAVCGMVAGAYYGMSGIPEKWLEQLAMRGEIERMAEALRMLVPGDTAWQEARDLVALLPEINKLEGGNVVQEWVGGSREKDDNGKVTSFVMSEPVYDPVVDQVREAMSVRVLQDYWYRTDRTDEMMEYPALLSEASLGELRKVICRMVRRERFIWGDAWSDLFESGIVRRVVRRLGELVEGRAGS